MPMSDNVSKTVSTTGDYREGVSAADTLDLSVESTYFTGAWETSNGEAIFLSGSNFNIVKAGWSYFHVEVDDTTYKCKPSNTSSIKEPGKVEIIFS